MYFSGHTPRPRPARRRSFLGLGAALAALLVLLAPAAEAATDSPSPHGRLTHPERDWMGSTVAAHEGRSATTSGSAAPSSRRTPGFDVSNHQGTVNWAAAYQKGARFAYIKATEGTTYRDPDFNANYVHAYSAGYIRGAYHFATPNTSSGKTQADYFIAHGGKWSRDGKTLPPMLDIEYNPYGATCFGMSRSAMRSWISAFVNEVHAKTSRWATIYTSTNWWTSCTGNTAGYSAHDPLFVARYASSAGTLPAGWPFYTFWQYANSGTFPGDQDYFNGTITNLRNLANNT